MTDEQGHWNASTHQQLLELGIDSDVARSVIGIITEHRMSCDLEGFKRGFEAGVKAQSLKDKQDRDKKKTPLPSEPPEFFWETVDYALDKLNQIERDDRYVISPLPSWRVRHSPFEGKTYLDLAGCLLTDSLPPSRGGDDRVLGYLWEDTLFALHLIDNGKIVTTIDYINNISRCSKDFPSKVIPSEDVSKLQDAYTHYRIDPKQFKKYLSEVITVFRQHSL